MTDCLRLVAVRGADKKSSKNLQKRFEKIVDDDILRTRCPPKGGKAD